MLTCRNIIGSEISFSFVPTLEKDLSELVSALHYTLHYCTTPHCNALPLTLLQNTFLYCITPHCIATHLRVVHHNSLQRLTHLTFVHITSLHCIPPYCTTLHHPTLLHYTSLNCIAPHWLEEEKNR